VWTYAGAKLPSCRSRQLGINADPSLNYLCKSL